MLKFSGSLNAVLCYFLPKYFDHFSKTRRIFNKIISISAKSFREPEIGNMFAAF